MLFSNFIELDARREVERRKPDRWVARHERVGGQTNTVRAVAGCDVVFGCMDSIDGRHLLNKLATFYVIPYFDPSVKLEADGTGGGDAAENAARGFHDTAANELIERAGRGSEGMT